MEDTQIIAAYFERDETAIQYTHQKYGKYCFQIAYRILLNREDSEECVNDTYLKTWQVIPPQKPNYLQMFLAKITRNEAFDRYRKNKALKRGGTEMELVLDELSECIGKSTTEEFIRHKQLSESIHQFLSQLPKRERNVFIRRYFYVESTEEIAEMYNLKPSHVYVLLSRTRNKLKEHLLKEGYI